MLRLPVPAGTSHVGGAAHVAAIGAERAPHRDRRGQNADVAGAHQKGRRQLRPWRGPFHAKAVAVRQSPNFPAPPPSLPDSEAARTDRRLAHVLHGLLNTTSLPAAPHGNLGQVTVTVLPSAETVPVAVPGSRPYLKAQLPVRLNLF